MKVAVSLIVLFVVSSLASAQRHDTGIRRDTRAKGTAYKSLNSDAVAAALKKNTSPAKDLAKIEHQNTVHQSRTTSSAPAPAPNNTTTARNKPVHFAYKAPKKPH